MFPSSAVCAEDIAHWAPITSGLLVKCVSFSW